LQSKHEFVNTVFFLNERCSVLTITL